MILELAQQKGLSPKRVSSSKGGVWVSPCPHCGGKDRFNIFPNQGERGTFFCRGCDRAGDAIEFLMHYDGMTFISALNVLRLEKSHKPMTRAQQTKIKKEFEAKVYNSPEEKWKAKAGELLSLAQEEIYKNEKVLAWLLKRGICEDAIKYFGLGYLPGENGKDCYYRGREAWGLESIKQSDGKNKKLWIPRGLVIPKISVNNEVLRLRIRRPQFDMERFLPDLKYFIVPGSEMSPLLLHAQNRNNKAYVVQESELDAMMLVWQAQKAGLDVGSLSVGTAKGKPDEIAFEKMKEALCVLVALDFDAPDTHGKRAGAEGSAWWNENFKQSKRWPPILGKDLGEDFEKGSNIAEWLVAGLPPVFSMKFQKSNKLPKKEIKEEVTKICEASVKQEAHKEQKINRDQCQTQTAVKKRWHLALADTPIEKITTPPGCPHKLFDLRQSFAGKKLEEKTLVPCPKLDKAWWWKYVGKKGKKHNCFDCSGHEKCLFDLLFSPMMLAPLAKKTDGK